MLSKNKDNYTANADNSSFSGTFYIPFTCRPSHFKNQT